MLLSERIISLLHSIFSSHFLTSIIRGQTLGIETHSTEDPDVSLTWKLKNQNQILNWLLGRDLPTNLPLEFSRWGLDPSNWIAYRTSEWDHTLTNLGINYRGWREHIYSPAPVKNWLRCQKLHLHSANSLLYLEKPQLQFEIPSKTYTGDVFIGKKWSYGLLQGHRMLIVKTIMGNGGKTEIERGNDRAAQLVPGIWRDWDGITPRRLT